MAIKKLPSTGDAPRATGVPASLESGGETDSAGFGWAGREFSHHDTQFAEDSGESPEAFNAAVRELRQAAAGDDAVRLAAAHSDALLALSEIRLLVPLVADAGEIGFTPEGKPVEKTQELSIVTVAAKDGRRAMPVFTSVTTMRAWNPTSRPIPVPAPQVAVAAAQELSDLIIVDAGTPEAEFGVRATELEKLALGEPSLPAWADPRIAEAFLVGVADEPLVKSVIVAPGDATKRLMTPEVNVELTLQPGLEIEVVRELLARVQLTWAAHETLARGIDSLRIMVR